MKIEVDRIDLEVWAYNTARAICQARSTRDPAQIPDIAKQFVEHVMSAKYPRLAFELLQAKVQQTGARFVPEFYLDELEKSYTVCENHIDAKDDKAEPLPRPEKPSGVVRKTSRKRKKSAKKT